MLCQSLIELADLIGFNPAMHLTRVLGGGRWYVPESFPDSHPIVAAIGKTAAGKISTRYCGTELEVPRGTAVERHLRNVEIHRRFNAGESTRSIALALHLSQRMVRYILSRPAPGNLSPYESSTEKQESAA